MNYKFNILNKCYKTIEYFNKPLNNYPKSEIILKQNIEKTLYELIEYLFSYNINVTCRIKEKYLKDFLIKLSMLDFYTRLSYFKKCISKRQFEVLGRKYLEIRKMVYALINNEKSNSEV